jgi:Smg protein
MKEDIFDVLIYLFENYMDNEAFGEFIDSDAIQTELLEAGFEQPEVTKAFNWLESLNLQYPIASSQNPNFRIFCSQEQAKLDIDCQNLLIFLEKNGILNSANREIVIDRAMALEDEDISLEKLKWIVLMVLLSLPDEALAFSRMEDMIYDFAPDYLH